MFKLRINAFKNLHGKTAQSPHFSFEVSNYQPRATGKIRSGRSERDHWIIQRF